MTQKLAYSESCTRVDSLNLTTTFKFFVDLVVFKIINDKTTEQDKIQTVKNDDIDTVQNIDEFIHLQEDSVRIRDSISEFILQRVYLKVIQPMKASQKDDIVHNFLALDHLNRDYDYLAF